MGCTAIRSGRTAFGSEALLMTAAVISVSTKDGQMAFTRMCSCPWSMAMHLVSRTTAPFEGAYEARLRAPLIPRTEAMLIIVPPPAFRIAGRTARESSQRPRTLTMKVSSHCSSVICSAVPM